MKTDTIKARIVGKSVEFRLERQYPHVIAGIEGRIGHPLFVAFRQIAEGTWTTSHFLPILSAAHAGAPHRLIGAESALVKRALMAAPPGIYAPLVAKVIEAFLFGIDEEEATFDDSASLAEIA